MWRDATIFPMTWVEVFVAFAVSHLVGDFLFQTEWQATHKRGGLGRDRVARRALLAHGAGYMLAFVPALIWIAGDRGAVVLLVAAAIGVPHVAQDDGRVVAWWMRQVKGADFHHQPLLAVSVDQVLHIVALFALAPALGG